MADLIRVNGNQFSYGSIILKLDGDRYFGFTGVTFADKRERVKAYGMGRHQAPIGRSRGKYSVDPVKVVGWKGAIQRFRLALALKSSDQKSYGDVEFQAIVQYVESSDSSEIAINIELDRCVWSGNSASDEESADPLKEEIELDCMLIRRNGLVLFDNTQTGNQL
jgi:hypothetical protein